MRVIDPLHDESPPGVLWTRANAGEAIPGVLTPVCWSFYGRLAETSVRRGFADLGVIPVAAASYPAQVGDRLMGIFHGRYSLNVGTLRNLMCGLPGVTGDDIERDTLGYTRENVQDEGFGNRTAAVALMAPGRLLRVGARSERLRKETGEWWRERVGPEGPRIDPRRLFVESIARWEAAIRQQGSTRMLFSGAIAQLTALAEQAGDPTLATALLAGDGSLEEAVVADDLWRVATGELALAEFAARHGYHGPNGGDIVSRSWREDTAPLERLLPTLRGSVEPAARRAQLIQDRKDARWLLLDGLPRSKRPSAKLILRIAPAAGHALERTKTSFLVALDGARAAVRALGAQLTADGRLADPEDAFFLLAEELRDAPPGDLQSIVDFRRERHAAHSAVTLPETWEGQPVPVQPETAPQDGEVSGIGVSRGVVKGRVRVVLDPSDDVDVEVGDILVCPATEPSWVSLMTIAGGLVIDIGGPASHGAIVARELGVPCVTGTRIGTKVLRDGMVVRIDGSTGSVEVLSGYGETRSTQG